MRSAGQIPLSRALDNARKEAAVRYSGTAANGATETISPLIFHPASPSNLRPFRAPPSIGRRECPREPLPLEGAAERSKAGLAFFFFGGEAASSLPSPLGKEGRVSGGSGALVYRRLETHFPTYLSYR